MLSFNGNITLNKVVNEHQFLWANETKLWNVRAEILMRAYLTPYLKI